MAIEDEKSGSLGGDEKITSRKTDYSRWYQDVVRAADLAESSQVKGCMIIKPNGYAIWENIQVALDKMIKETGVRNAYFPLLIPERFLKKEAEHVEGFSPEIAAVTYAGGKKLQEALVIRPTSETIIYDTFSDWIQSHRDLPLLINQWANVVRWEMRPRLFLRTTEFLWQEGHTAHASEKEADARARQMLEVYEKFMKDVLAIPVISGVKTNAERFAGAKYTYTVEAMMQDGKALQMGTSHNLGQNFAKVFDITFSDTETGERKMVWQTSWGVSTRMIGGLIMVHSDDTGLVLPPKVAATQAVLIPIMSGVEVTDKSLIDQTKTLKKMLDKAGIDSVIDDSDDRAGAKFFVWERRGIPVRIEIGPKDLEKQQVVLVRRDTGEKLAVGYGEMVRKTRALLKNIQSSLYRKALKFQKDHIKKADTWDSFVSLIEGGNFVLAHWCGDEKVEREIQEKTGATIRCILFDQKKEKGKCILSGRPSDGRVVFAKAY